jgi:hypothetical protein
MTTVHTSGASKEAVGNLYQFASMDVLKFYEMAMKQKTHKCYSHDQLSYAEVDLKKAMTAINTGKVKLRKIGIAGECKGQQVICVQDLPSDCYTIKTVK